MDPVTRQTIEDFMNFIDVKMQEEKHLKQFRVGTWSLTEYKVTVHVLNPIGTHKIYFDEREILENKTNFAHLWPSAADQLTQFLK